MLCEQEFWWETYGTQLQADGALFRSSAPPLYNATNRSFLAAAQQVDPAVQQVDREFLLYPYQGDGPVVPGTGHQTGAHKGIPGGRLKQMELLSDVGGGNILESSGAHRLGNLDG